MKEHDIMHESGDYWVYRDKGVAYAVMKAGIAHSVCDSTYAPTPDGLSIAVARCNYLAKRADSDVRTVR